MNNQRGQVLLITIMLLATVLTVTLAVTFKSTTETQLTKLEEESQKALAAAEAGIEAALKSGSADIGALDVGNFTGQATSGPKPSSPTTFVSPLLQKDQQYTFYLADPNNGFSSPHTGNLFLYYGLTGTSECDLTQSADDLGLELTVVYDNPTKIQRLIADSSKRFGGTAGLTVTASGSYTAIDNQKFYCRVTIASGALNITYPNPKFLIARVFFNQTQTRVGFQNTTSGIDLPTQGKYITSEAKSSTGVTKRVQLFQSYPQIPAEFFVTSF